MEPRGVKPSFSISIGIYRSREDLPRLLSELNRMALENAARFDVEVIFVVDGSPDDSLAYLEQALNQPHAFRWKLVELTKNFGATFAMRCGFAEGTGNYFAPLPSDLQDPVDLIRQSFDKMVEGKVELCIGQRETRQDPPVSRMLSYTFWWLYRTFFQKDVPQGGLDFFACNRAVRDQLVRIKDRGAFFIGHIINLGLRSTLIPYHRQERRQGKSSWSLSKKLGYFFDSMFCFSTLPIKLLMTMGVIGMSVAVTLSAITLYYKLRQQIPVVGFSQTMIMICFFGGMNSLGLGVIGEYVWRVYENTLDKPVYTISNRRESDSRTSHLKKEVG